MVFQTCISRYSTRTRYPKVATVEREKEAERKRFEQKRDQLGVKVAEARTQLFHAEENHKAAMVVMMDKQESVITRWIEGKAKDTIRHAFGRW